MSYAETPWALQHNTLIITKRGNRQTGESFTMHTFPISEWADIDRIIAHPSIAGWKYGYSVGLMNK